MSTSYTKLTLKAQLIPAALGALGAVDVTVDKVAAVETIYRGVLEGIKFQIKVFENKGGLYTLGASAGFDRPIFDKVATHLVNACCISKQARYEYSISKFGQGNFDALLEFLIAEGGKKVAEEATPHSKRVRIEGPKGDVLTINCYTNGTIQFQGVFAHLANLVDGFLREVLSLSDVLEQQKQIYKIDVTVQAIQDELAGRIPVCHSFLAEAVRKQFSSALALTKVDLPLEDYAPLCFPALRGLEGFTFQLFREGKFNPPKVGQLGDYFKQDGHNFCIRTPQGDHLNEGEKTALVNCYGTWHKERHSLFHMDGTVETTRTIQDRGTALSIVNKVFDLVDEEYKRFKKA